MKSSFSWHANILRDNSRDNVKAHTLYNVCSNEAKWCKQFKSITQMSTHGKTADVLPLNLNNGHETYKHTHGARSFTNFDYCMFSGWLTTLFGFLWTHPGTTASHMQLHGVGRTINLNYRQYQYCRQKLLDILITIVFIEIDRCRFRRPYAIVEIRSGDWKRRWQRKRPKVDFEVARGLYADRSISLMALPWMLYGVCLCVCAWVYVLCVYATKAEWEKMLLRDAH